MIDVPHKSIRFDTNECEKKLKEVDKNKRFPVFLIIKDADKFPVFLNKLEFKFELEKRVIKHKVSFSKGGKKINSAFFKETFYFDLSEFVENGIVTLNSNISVDIVNNIDKKRISKNYNNDNFNFGRFVKDSKDLKFYLNDNEKLFENYYQGDLHYHSFYTKDHVEYGAPLSMTKDCGKFLNMRFTFITDHSYDLDDMENNYLKKDPNVSMFHNMKNECKELSNNGFDLINSEEVTVRNSRGRNVHLIIANEDIFFHGTGDDAEEWLKTTSENSISDVLSNISDNSLALAAHPFVKTPFLEGLLIKRGEWSKKDILQAHNDFGFNLIQILNGELDSGFFNGLRNWIELLLDNKKFFIVAGNDAHGNFSSFRQIEIPMFNMTKKNNKQLYGKCKTVVYNKSSDKATNIIKNIRKGACYITNGAHIDFSVLYMDNIYKYGEEIVILEFTGEVKASVFFEIHSSIFSGFIKSIKIFCGNLIEKKEFIIL